MVSIRLPYKLPIIVLFTLATLAANSPLPLLNTEAQTEETQENENDLTSLEFSRSDEYSYDGDAQVLGITDSEDPGVLQSKQAEIARFYSKLRPTVEERRRKREEINKLVKFLKRQGSPIATQAFAEQIITLSEANGADYKVVVAIMGIESGFCIAPYMKYNCFGYLNGIQYSNFEHAISRLVPAISKQYARVYGTNFVALAQAYGMINYTYHAPRMQGFYNALR